jgi:hypothetical protein
LLREEEDFVKSLFLVCFTLAVGSWLLASICHAELVSASVRGEGLVMARGEILKRVQDDGGKCWLLPIKRLKDGKLNSRGFSNPWKT